MASFLELFTTKYNALILELCPSPEEAWERLDVFASEIPGLSAYLLNTEPESLTYDDVLAKIKNAPGYKLVLKERVELADTSIRMLTEKPEKRNRLARKLAGFYYLINESKKKQTPPPEDE